MILTNLHNSPAPCSGFNGVSKNSFDGRGNYTLGIKSILFS